MSGAQRPVAQIYCQIAHAGNHALVQRDVIGAHASLQSQRALRPPQTAGADRIGSAAGPNVDIGARRQGARIRQADAGGTAAQTALRDRLPQAGVGIAGKAQIQATAAPADIAVDRRLALGHHADQIARRWRRCLADAADDAPLGLRQIVDADRRSGRDRAKDRKAVLCISIRAQINRDIADQRLPARAVPIGHRRKIQHLIGRTDIAVNPCHAICRQGQQIALQRHDQQCAASGTSPFRDRQSPARGCGDLANNTDLIAAHASGNQHRLAQKIGGRGDFVVAKSGDQAQLTARGNRAVEGEFGNRGAKAHDGGIGPRDHKPRGQADALLAAKFAVGKINQDIAKRRADCRLSGKGVVAASGLDMNIAPPRQSARGRDHQSGYAMQAAIGIGLRPKQHIGVIGQTDIHLHCLRAKRAVKPRVRAGANPHHIAQSQRDALRDTQRCRVIGLCQVQHNQIACGRKRRQDSQCVQRIGIGAQIQHQITCGGGNRARDRDRVIARIGQKPPAASGLHGRRADRISPRTGHKQSLAPNRELAGQRQRDRRCPVSQNRQRSASRHAFCAQLQHLRGARHPIGQINKDIARGRRDSPQINQAVTAAAGADHQIAPCGQARGRRHCQNRAPKPAGVGIGSAPNRGIGIIGRAQIDRSRTKRDIAVQSDTGAVLDPYQRINANCHRLCHANNSRPGRSRHLIDQQIARGRQSTADRHIVQCIGIAAQIQHGIARSCSQPPRQGQRVIARAQKQRNARALHGRIDRNAVANHARGQHKIALRGQQTIDHHARAFRRTGGDMGVARRVQGACQGDIAALAVQRAIVGDNHQILPRLNACSCRQDKVIARQEGRSATGRNRNPRIDRDIIAVVGGAFIGDIAQIANHNHIRRHRDRAMGLHNRIAAGIHAHANAGKGRDRKRAIVEQIGVAGGRAALQSADGGVDVLVAQADVFLRHKISASTGDIGHPLKSRVQNAAA